MRSDGNRTTGGLAGHFAPVRALALNADGSVLLTVSGNVSRLHGVEA